MHTLNISHTCVERHLKKLGYINKLDIWVQKRNDFVANPIQISETSKEARIAQRGRKNSRKS